MKKLLFIVSLLLIGCETNQNRDNATWTFDASTETILNGKVKMILQMK